MANKIKLTPVELKTQASEMLNMSNQYLAIFGEVYSELNIVNSNWSKNLSRNFISKIVSAQNSFIKVTEQLTAGSKVAEATAVTFEEVDSRLAKLALQRNINPREDWTNNSVTTPLDVGEYMDKVTDAEYARLCKLAYDATNGSTPEEDFIKLIQNDRYLPDSDPLKNINANQVTFVGGQITGFSAFIIADGDDAIVLFVGTNDDPADFIADITLGIGGTPLQLIQANALIQLVAEQYSNITVTGHSLGGYLATGVTLDNAAVDKCISFDAPGRYDALWQNMTNSNQVSKITNYEANGSLISAVGFDINGRVGLDVKSSGGLIDRNHDIGNICDALGGQGAIKNSWGEVLSGGGHDTGIYG